jgi:hypothetical protein
MVSLHLPRDEYQGLSYGRCQWREAETHSQSEGEIWAETSERKDPGIGIISVMVFGHWMQIESMIHEWQPNSHAVQRGFWRNPGEQRKIWLQNTHGRQRGGNGAIEEDRTKKKVKVADKEIRKRKKKRSSRRDRVSRVDHIRPVYDLPELPSGKVVDWTWGRSIYSRDPD